MKKYIALTLALALLIAFAVPMAFANPGMVSGKVVSTIDSGNYTYVEFESNGQNLWAAITKEKLKKGQNITFIPGMWMSNFKAKSLNRTFAKIYFTSGIMK